MAYYNIEHTHPAIFSQAAHPKAACAPRTLPPAPDALSSSVPGVFFDASQNVRVTVEPIDDPQPSV